MTTNPASLDRDRWLNMDMSAQQPQHAPVRLLIAEKSENAAHEYDSLLRDAGIATRLEIIDLPMASSRLAEADLMLCNAALPQLSQILPQLVAVSATHSWATHFRWP